MADTVYVDGSTLLTADTMNDVNRLHYTILGDPADLSALRNTVTDGKATVASHATTGDIWGDDCAIIDWTGTATTTAFPDAPYASARRTLVCAGACLFTAGANLLIEGIPSGTTVTMAANAIVNVLAITTTQFKITYSVSGTFTATGTGFNGTDPTVTAKYSVVNGYAHLYIPEAGLTGTSDSVLFSITGLPSCIVPASQKVLPIMNGINNGAVAFIQAVIPAATSAISLFQGTTSNFGVWTASGTKTLQSTEFSYSLS